MIHEKSPHRPGLTAIAAVLALSSTPLFAQSAETAPAVSTEPVLVTPPPVAARSAPALPTVSAMPAPATAPVIQNAAPAATAPMVNVPAPVSNAPAAPRIATPEPAARTAQPAPRRAPAPRVVDSAPSTPPASTPAPVEAAPAPAPVAAAPVAEMPAPAPVAATRTTQTDATDEMLPIGLAGGAAVLLLAGGAFALSRRRRTAAEGVYVADTVTTPAEAVMVTPAPVAAAPLAYTPPLAVPGDTRHPLTAVPAGFDVSRFGRHTQAAYRGPTPENPSLSLKRRLKRASFYDGRERMAAESARKPFPAYVPAPNTAPAQRKPEYVTTKVAPPARPSFRPAYQS